MTMSIFDHASAARRYAQGRPYFHLLVIEKTVAYTGIARCGQAVDVCCGTGQSTRALKQIAARVTGMDIAPEMLRLAPALEDTRWICCPAEKLAADDASCDLMTVALAFHWLDRHEFLREAWRVLRTGAWLVI